MTIREYTDPDWNELMSLYAAVGWTNYTDEPEMLRAAYTHSLCILAAYEDDRLLGVVRAVGDGASIVFIQDILVFPKYQRRGIGKALLCAMMERYRTAVSYTHLDVYKRQSVPSSAVTRMVTIKVTYHGRENIEMP